MFVVGKNNISNPRVVLTAIILFVSLAAFYISFSLGYGIAGFLSDDAVYLLLAEIYSPWVDVDKPVFTFLLDHNRFPPLYPLILGFFGADSENIQTAVGVNCLLFIISCLVVGLWNWRETKAPYIAIFLTTVFALLPASLIFTQEIWSEFLYILLSYLVLLFLSDNDHRTNKTWLLIGLIISLVTITRTVGLTLVITYAILLILNKPRNSLLLLILSILPFTTWYAFNSLKTSSQGYLTEIIGQAQSFSLLNLHHYLQEWCLGFWQSWCWLFTLNNGTGLSLIQSLLVVFCLLLAIIGFLIRIRKKTADAIYLIVYLSVLFIWPYSSDHFITRFQYPLIPIYLLCIWQAINTLAVTKFRLRLMSCAIVASILFLIAPADIRVFARAYANIDDDLRPYTRTREWLLSKTEIQGQQTVRNMKVTIELLQKIQKRIPAHECVYAVQAPLVMLHARRITGVLPATGTDLKLFMEQTGSCRFILGMNLVDHGGRFPRFYPLARIQGTDNYIIYPYHAEKEKTEEVNMYLIERKF